MKSSTTLAALVAHCRKLARRQQTSDAELLRRFVERRDAAAFEELVERYAPLIWGVCRRILPNETDCEDAFQAAFLCLVHRAGSIAPSRPLGAWLHTIAVRVAAKARASLLRQPKQATIPEQSTRGDIADKLANRELFRVIDEEIARLPSLLRGAFVLCCLEGRTRDEAAAALGCSVAAIKSRLERSRNLLRQRLERRGIGLPAALLVLGLTGGHVSASLRAKALQCVLGSAPAAIAALVPAVGVSLASKLTLTAMSLVIVSALGLGAFHVMQTEPSKEAPAQAKDTAPKSPPSPAAEKPQPRLDRYGDPLPPGAVRRFGTVRFRYHEIVDLAFSPDGKRLIAGSGRPPRKVCNAITGRPLRDVGKVSGNNPHGFTLSPDRKRAACCGSDVSLWDLETGKLLRELGCGRCQSVAFSPDGKKVAAALEARLAELFIVDADTGKRLCEWKYKQELPRRYRFGSLAFSPDGKFVAVILSKDRQEKSGLFTSAPIHVCLLDAATCKLVRTIGSADDPIHAFAFQPGTGRLAGIDKDGILRFWDVETGKELHRLAAIKGARHVLLFTADGRRCIALNKEAGFLAVLDARDGRELHRITIGPDASPALPVLALSPDGRSVALAKKYRGSRVRVWDISSGAERLAGAGHDEPAILSLSTDGRTLLSRDNDGQLFHWDLQTGASRFESFPVGEEIGRRRWAWGVMTVRSPRWRLTIDVNKMEMEVHGLGNSRLRRKVNIPTMTHGFALSPDGSHLAVAFSDDRSTIFLWDPEKEEAPRTLAGHPGYCQELLFSHDGKRLIAGTSTHNVSQSQTVWIWDVATARLIRKLATTSEPDHMLLTADDRVLLTGGLFNDATVHAWDMETGKELACIADPSLKYTSVVGNVFPKPSIDGFALSADERFLAIVSSSGDASSVSVWEMGSWKPIRTFAPIQPPYFGYSMVFSRDSRSLFIANIDSTILEWDVSGRFGRKTETPNRDRLNVLWRKLAETPDKAYPFVWELLDHPAESVPFLIEKVSPVKPVEEKRVRQLLAQLDSESFVEREKAGDQLLALGEQIVPILRQALKERLTLEVRKRVEGVIESLNRGPTTEQLRLLRALAVLEWSNRPEGIEHLRRLAGGAPSASLTCAAQAAWQRQQK